MIDFYLKNNEEGNKYLKQIKVFCKQLCNNFEYDLQIQEYSNFIVVNIKDSNICAIVRMNNALTDYILWLSHFDNKMAEVRIPISAIDTIYHL